MTSRRSDSSDAHSVPARSHLLPPCEVRCPIHEEIQRSNILISLLPHDPETALSRIIEIGDALFQKNPLFTVCGYVCGICELECSYKDTGGAIQRRLLKRFIAERYMERLAEIQPFPAGDLGKVAIIGAGPAGLMAAYELSRRGYQPTIFEAGDLPGGALRLIPGYRLPQAVLDDTLAALVRVAGVTIHYRSPLGTTGCDLQQLRRDGFSAIFIAAGSPAPRILEYAGMVVPGQQLKGVMYGHTFLYERAHGLLPDNCLAGRRIIVVGGGNVAFDAARSARRLGGITTIVCLESNVVGRKESIPADPHEVSAAAEEGIEIVYSRGVAAITSADGNFRSIKAPRCTRVYDGDRFNPAFDSSDMIDIPGELLIIAVGQGPERRFLQNEGLLDERGKVAIDPVTLQSLVHETVFLGGDMLRLGFMVDAMRDGLEAAESIDRFIRGLDLREGRTAEFTSTDPPFRHDYRSAPVIVSLPPEERLHFTLFEKGFTPDEAISEARRCLACGPCASCEACLKAGVRTEISTCEVVEERCSGCGICVTACPFGAAAVERRGERMISVTNLQLCRGCGLCVAACPAAARRLCSDSSLNSR